jgi:DNA-binding XRE family transcriptional regulator
MAKVLELCGMIHSKYDSEARFADSLGWARQKLNKITNGKKEPSLEEVAQISAGLEESFEKVANIFLDRSHQTGNYVNIK